MPKKSVYVDVYKGSWLTYVSDPKLDVPLTLLVDSDADRHTCEGHLRLVPERMREIK